MLEDERARTTIEELHAQWLELEKVGSTSLTLTFMTLTPLDTTLPTIFIKSQPDMKMETKVFIDEIIFQSGLLRNFHPIHTLYNGTTKCTIWCRNR